MTELQTLKTVSVFDNRTKKFWSPEQIRERGIEWFISLSEVKETLNWNLNGAAEKYRFAWCQSGRAKSTGYAFVFD